MLENYDFIGERAMQYFKRRLDQANRDAGLASTAGARRRRRRGQAGHRGRALKCNVLWAQLDALHHAYVTPRLSSARRRPSGGRMSTSNEGRAHHHHGIFQAGAAAPHQAAADATRDVWTVLAPERVYDPRCDRGCGAAAVRIRAHRGRGSASELARTYSAPKEPDTWPTSRAMLQELADKGVVKA